jgi:hypothetical protein
MQSGVGKVTVTCSGLNDDARLYARGRDPVPHWSVRAN